LTQIFLMRDRYKINDKPLFEKEPEEKLFLVKSFFDKKLEEELEEELEKEVEKKIFLVDTIIFFHP